MRLFRGPRGGWAPNHTAFFFPGQDARSLKLEADRRLNHSSLSRPAVPANARLSAGAEPAEGAGHLVCSLAAPEPEKGHAGAVGARRRRALGLPPPPTASDGAGPTPAGLRPRLVNPQSTCVCMCGMGCVCGGRYERETEVGWKMPVIICVFVLYARKRGCELVGVVEMHDECKRACVSVKVFVSVGVLCLWMSVDSV